MPNQGAAEHNGSYGTTTELQKEKKQSLAKITQAIENFHTHESQHKPKVGGRITNPSTSHDIEFCRYEPRVNCIQLRSSEPEFS